MNQSTILQDFIAKGVPPAYPSETLRDYLSRLDVLDHGFTWSEIVNPKKHNKQAPPKALRIRGRTIDAWANMARAVCLANVIRERAIVEVPGLKYLTIAAAYRPEGGASNSAHKEAAALDLDAHKGADLKAWYRLLVRIWSELAEPTGDVPDKPGDLPFGLGLYTWAGKIAGVVPVRSGYRGHIDVNAIAGTRSWQGIRSGFGRPHKIKNRRGANGYYGLPVLLAVEQGLDVPSLRDL